MGHTIEQALNTTFGLQRFKENPALDATIRKTLQRYPSLRSDEKTQDAEAKPKNIIMLTHDQQIKQAHRSAQPPFQPTDYQGLKVENRIADQLAQQPASELLLFEKSGDKTRIQAKLPEKGYDPKSGKEYSIRVNMNYLAQGMVRFAMNEDGSIDTDKAMELTNLRDRVTDAVSQAEYDAASKAFIDAMKIPPEARADFETFFRVNVDPLNSDFSLQDKTGSALLHGFNDPASHMYKELLGNLAPYQYAAQGNMPTGTNSEKATKEGVAEVVKRSERDFRNICETYRLMADMDPKTEQRILYPMDCKSFRNVTAAFVDQNNAWREKNGLERVDFKPGDLNFANQEEDPENDVTLAFDEHHYLAFPVKVDGKDVVLSLETTAPPDGKIVERGGVERTGVGLFESKEAIDRFHESVNLSKVENRNDYAAIKHMNVRLNNGGYNFAPQANTWERESFHAKELARYGNDQQVLDCFARHMVAGAAMLTDAAHRPPYDKALIDKSVAELKNGRSFQLMAKTYGAQKLREVLASSDPQVASMALYAPPKEQRYALDEQTKQQLRALGASMQTEKRSDEWKALREALTDPKMKDSSKIFDAVEKYTKGKKSVRMTQAGRDSFDLAMTALAIAAKKGDPAAKQRAQNLVDRVNEVRGAQNAKHKHHVSLDAYAPEKSNGPERKMEKTEPQTYATNS